VVALNFGAVGADVALASTTPHDHLDIEPKKTKEFAHEPNSAPNA
jgi:hypothetical protein